MPVGAKGVDVSTWQHPDNKPIDWEAVAAAGYTFVVVKATQGASYANPWLARDLDDAFAAGLLTGAYHYYEAGTPADVQAKQFVGSLMGARLDLGAFLDYEVAVNSDWTQAADINNFIEAAKDGRPGCGLYCSVSTWEALQKANVVVPKLWLASWGADDAPAGATIWQYGQAEVPGVPASVDVDILTSTRGVNIPTGPAARPSPVTARPVVVALEGEPAPRPGPDEVEVMPGPVERPSAGSGA